MINSILAASPEIVEVLQLTILMGQAHYEKTGVHRLGHNNTIKALVKKLNTIRLDGLSRPHPPPQNH